VLGVLSMEHVAALLFIGLLLWRGICEILTMVGTTLVAVDSIFLDLLCCDMISLTIGGFIVGMAAAAATGTTSMMEAATEEASIS